jgi:hypothetical protein
MRSITDPTNTKKLVWVLMRNAGAVEPCAVDTRAVQIDKAINVFEHGTMRLIRPVNKRWQ